MGLQELGGAVAAPKDAWPFACASWRKGFAAVVVRVVPCWARGEHLSARRRQPRLAKLGRIFHDTCPRRGSSLPSCWSWGDGEGIDQVDPFP